MEAIEFIILQIFFATRVVSKIGEYSRIFPRFSWGMFGHVTCLDQSRARKYLMDYKLRYLSLDVVCSSKLTVFFVLRSRKTFRFSEQVMSANKYPSICPHQFLIYPTRARGIIVKFTVMAKPLLNCVIQ